MGSKYQTFLSILKYTGLAIAMTSSLWSAITIEAKEKAGRKKFTRAGKISLGLMILGFTVALASNILEDRVNAEKDKDRAQEELARENRLSLAGQPLTSLNVEWTFEGVDQSLMDFLSAQKQMEFDTWNGCFFNVDMSEKDAKRMNNYFVLYPFLDRIGMVSSFSSEKAPKGSVKTGKNVLAVISLETSHNAVLALGNLETGPAKSKFKTATKRSGGLLYPAGVRAYSENPCDDDVQSGTLFQEPYLDLEPDSKRLSIQWTLDTWMFQNSVDRSSTGPISAGLPPRLSAIILPAVTELPFVTDDFATPGQCPLWEDSDHDENISTTSLPFSKSQIHLIPNGRSELATYYELISATDHCVTDEYHETCKCGGLLLKFEAKKLKH